MGGDLSLVEVIRCVMVRVVWIPFAPICGHLSIAQCLSPFSRLLEEVQLVQTEVGANWNLCRWPSASSWWIQERIQNS